MKLVYEHNWCVEYVADGTDTIPIEYSSKEDFQYMVLELIDNHKKSCIEKYGKKDGNNWYRNGSIELFNRGFNVGDLEDSIDTVYELDEWFEKNKRKT